MTQIVNTEESLDREISRLGFSAIALNGLIGAGIFALPAVAAARSGAFSPWMFVICGVLIMTVVVSIAKAASYFRNTGGPIVYATQSFGRFTGFQTGWLLGLARAASTAANTNLLVTYAGWFWAPLEGGIQRAIAIALVCLILTVLNIIGVRKSMLTVYIFTLLKLIPLSLLVLLGISYVDPGLLFGAELPVPNTLGDTILVLLYAYVGFEGAVVPAGEARDPRKDIPRALMVTVIVTGIFYFLIQAVSVAVYPELTSSTTPLADVALVLMGSIGATILSLGAIFSISGNISAMMLSAPRMIYALSREGSLPGWFSRVHPKFHTPANSIGFLGIFAMVLALSGGFVWLAAMSTLVRLMVYGVSIASLPGLNKTLPEHKDNFRLWGGFAIPALGLVLCVWLGTHAKQEAWFTIAAFMAMGTVLYALARKSARQTAPAAE